MNLGSAKSYSSVLGVVHEFSPTETRPYRRAPQEAATRPASGKWNSRIVLAPPSAALRLRQSWDGPAQASVVTLLRLENGARAHDHSPSEIVTLSLTHELSVRSVVERTPGSEATLFAI
jgi:hypothetical protein